VVVFREVWPLLEERLRLLGLGQATAVYDAGNVSLANQRAVDASAIRYVTSVPPSQHPDLLAEPLSAFTTAAEAHRLGGVETQVGVHRVADAGQSGDGGTANQSLRSALSTPRRGRTIPQCSWRPFGPRAQGVVKPDGEPR
jgi:hypothetical protein